jgi:hypothetical protein
MGNCRAAREFNDETELVFDVIILAQSALGHEVSLKDRSNPASLFSFDLSDININQRRYHPR